MNRAVGGIYLQEVSVRKVKEITKALCGAEFSKSLISDLAKDLDLEVLAWRNRRLTQKYPHLIVDAKYEKACINSAITSQGVLIALGIDSVGKREIISVGIADLESESSWIDVSNLKEMASPGVKIMPSDDYMGLSNAIRSYLHGCYGRGASSTSPKTSLIWHQKRKRTSIL